MASSSMDVPPTVKGPVQKKKMKQMTMFELCNPKREATKRPMDPVHLGKDPKISKKDGMLESSEAASTLNLEMIAGLSSNGNENNIEKEEGVVQSSEVDSAANLEIIPAPSHSGKEKFKRKKTRCRNATGESSFNKENTLISPSSNSNIDGKVTEEKIIDQLPKDTESKPTLPVGYSEWLEKSVERWSLQPPYSLHTAEAWKKYYQERAALDWRSEHIWSESGDDCRGKCGEWYDPEKVPTWDLEWKQPRMKPCCAESYASDCGSTDKEEYTELVDHVRRRVEATLSTCSNISKSMAKAAGGGAYIIQYWINREECAKNAAVRTCHFENRFYVPIGSGDSYNLHYRYHYRYRSYGSEKFSDLYIEQRGIGECSTDDPTPIGEWYPCKCGRSKALDRSMTKMLSQDGKKKATRTTQGVLKEVCQCVLGSGKVRMSGRKTWELMARAGGMCAAGESGKNFAEAKGKLGKLGKGEDSDEEEASSRNSELECSIS